jgi:hypothetical protein
MMSGVWVIVVVSPLMGREKCPVESLNGAGSLVGPHWILSAVVRSKPGWLT